MTIYRVFHPAGEVAPSIDPVTVDRVAGNYYYLGKERHRMIGDKVTFHETEGQALADVERRLKGQMARLEKRREAIKEELAALPELLREVKARLAEVQEVSA